MKLQIHARKYPQLLHVNRRSKPLFMDLVAFVFSLFNVLQWKLIILEERNLTQVMNECKFSSIIRSSRHATYTSNIDSNICCYHRYWSAILFQSLANLNTSLTATKKTVKNPVAHYTRTIIFVLRGRRFFWSRGPWLSSWVLFLLPVWVSQKPVNMKNRFQLLVRLLFSVSSY